MYIVIVPTVNFIVWWLVVDPDGRRCCLGLAMGLQWVCDGSARWPARWVCDDLRPAFSVTAASHCLLRTVRDASELPNIGTRKHFHHHHTCLCCFLLTCSGFTVLIESDLWLFLYLVIYLWLIMYTSFICGSIYTCYEISKKKSLRSASVKVSGGYISKTWT